MKISKVSQLPALPCEPDHFYFIKVGNEAECYLSDNTGSSLNKVFISEESVAVIGPSVVGDGPQYTYNINDYDINGTYNVSATGGTATVAGDIITFQSNTVGDAVIAVNNTDIPVTVARINQAPVFNQTIPGLVLGFQGDPSFSYEYILETALFDNGDIVILYEISPDDNVVVSKFNSDGTRDTAFGVNGNLYLPTWLTVYTNIHLFLNNVTNEITILSFKYGQDSSFGNIILTKINNLGVVIDTSYLVTPELIELDFYADIKIKLSTGKYIITSRLRTTDYTTWYLYTFRLNADLTLDMTYGTNGASRIDVGSFNYWDFFKVTELDEIFIFYWDKILKINPNGTVDTTFGVNGILTLTEPSYDNCIIKDNKFIFIKQYFIYAVNMDGTDDLTFGPNGNGVTTYQIPGGQLWSGRCQAVKQSDGKIVFVYEAELGPATCLMSIRINNDGTIDTTYGVSGFATMYFSNSIYLYNDQHYYILPDNKFLLIGKSSNNNSGNEPGCILRINSNGSVDSTFGNSVDTEIDITRNYYPNTDVILLPNIKITDAELSGLNSGLGNFTNTTLHISRSTPDINDTFSVINSLSIDNNSLLVNGEIVGTITNINGAIDITFTAAVVPAALVNTVLQNITYRNITSPLVDLNNWVLDVTFSDQNTGSQGTEGIKLDIAYLTFGYSRGILLSTECSLSGSVKIGTFTDGNGYTMTAVIDPKSVDCGYPILFIHDTFTELTKTNLAQHITDTGQGWLNGHTSVNTGNPLTYHHEINTDGSLSILEYTSGDTPGTTPAYETAQGGNTRSFVDYQIPMFDYYVEVIAEVLPDAGDSSISIIGRLLNTPYGGSSMYADFTWKPSNSLASGNCTINDEAMGSIFLPNFASFNLATSYGPGTYTIRVEFIGHGYKAYIDSVLVATVSTITNIDVNSDTWVGVGTEIRANTNSQGIKVLDFKVGEI